MRSAELSWREGESVSARHHPKFRIPHSSFRTQEIMPTIEIVCLKQHEPLEIPKLSFAVESEREVVSHRDLFYKEFKKLSGCIYHLGSPDVRRRINGFFYAAELLDWTAEEDCLKCLPSFIPEVKQLMADLLSASSVQQLVFSSDHQFGPTIRRYQRPLKYETFWRKHDAGKLRLNALYLVRP